MNPSDEHAINAYFAHRVGMVLGNDYDSYHQARKLVGAVLRTEELTLSRYTALYAADPGTTAAAAELQDGIDRVRLAGKFGAALAEMVRTLLSGGHAHGVRLANECFPLRSEVFHRMLGDRFLPEPSDALDCHWIQADEEAQ